MGSTARPHRLLPLKKILPILMVRREVVIQSLVKHGNGLFVKGGEIYFLKNILGSRGLLQGCDLSFPIAISDKGRGLSGFGTESDLPSSSRRISSDPLRWSSSGIGPDRVPSRAGLALS